MNAPIPNINTHDSQIAQGAFHVSLIEEPLQCEKTGMPVLELLAVLRQYHHARDFSHMERFGTPDPQSRQALSELDDAQKSIRQLTSSAAGNNTDLRIEASLNLRTSPVL